MAFGNWEDVISVYEDVYLKATQSERAEHMLEIIQMLRNKVNPTLIPGVSHGSLFLERSDGEYCINLILLERDKYLISLERYKDYSLLQEVTVGDQKLLEEFLKIEGKMLALDA